MLMGGGSVTGAWRTYQDILFSNLTNYIPECFVSTHSHTIGSERSQTKERHHSRSCSNSKLSQSLSKGQVKKKKNWAEIRQMHQKDVSTQVLQEYSLSLSRFIVGSCSELFNNNSDYHLCTVCQMLCCTIFK